MSGATAQAAFSTTPTPQDPYRYQVGFGNRFASEAIPGALPVGQNTPQRVKYDLCIEGLTGTPFVGPRAQTQHSWLYRIRPSVDNKGFTDLADKSYIESDFTLHNPKVFQGLEQAYDPLALPPASERVTFLDGLRSVCGNGSPVDGEGVAVHVYAANASMERAALCNVDGDMLVQPQLGRLDVQTEFGRLMVKPGELVVVQRGIRFRISLPDGPSRGYVTELFGSHFELPELGPIGGHGLANPRDFQAPVASFDIDNSEWEVVYKNCGKFVSCSLDHTPFDVVAWHGSYVPYKYDLDKFVTLGSISKDHVDPSIYTVLTAKSRTPGVALADLAAVVERWDVTENTFRAPYFHRNCAAELIGIIRGAQGPNGISFGPGGFNFQNLHVPHGPTWEQFQVVTTMELKPQKVLEGALMFLIETPKPLLLTDWAKNENPHAQAKEKRAAFEPQFLKHLDAINSELKQARLPAISGQK